MSIIYEMDKKTGEIKRCAVYSCDTKQAIIAYIMQFKEKNKNTWLYPDNLSGIIESKTKKDCFYFDYDQDKIIASYPD